MFSRTWSQINFSIKLLEPFRLLLSTSSDYIRTTSTCDTAAFAFQLFLTASLGTGVEGLLDGFGDLLEVVISQGGRCPQIVIQNICQLMGVVVLDYTLIKVFGNM